MFSAEFSPKCFPFSIYRTPTSNSHHCYSVTNYRNPILNPNPNSSRISRNPLKVKAFADLDPTHLQSHDYEEPQFINMLKGKYEAGKYDESLAFLEFMVARGYKPNTGLCIKLIEGFFNRKQVEKAFTVIGIVESHGEPSASMYNAVINRFFSLNQVDEATQVLDRMRDRGVSPNFGTYTVLINSLCYRKLGLAMKIFEQMLDYNYEPTVGIYYVLIEATIIEGGINKAMKLFDDMVTRGVQPNESIYSLIIMGMFREGRMDQAFDTLRSLPSEEL